MKTETHTISDILEHGKLNFDGSTQVVPDMKKGAYAAQGDVNIFRIGSIPKHAKKLSKEEILKKFNSDGMYQLAPGTTKGSRHCMDNLQGVEVYELENPNPLQGEIFSIEQTKTIPHPEHGDLVFRQPGNYIIGYQRQHAEELKRIQD